MSRRSLLVLGLVPVLAICVSALTDGKVLYEKASRYNTLVVTDDGRGLRTLSFARYGARQSVVKVGDPDHLELPYVRGMLVGLAFAEDAKRILIVGLGGGSIPTFLHKHYPRMTIDVVDIDPDVVAVAKKFFGFREDATMHAYVDDGRRFIEACRNPYDIIFRDAYGADNVPYALTTREFLQAVRRALSPRGFVVANVWSRSSNALYDSMVRTYQDSFAALSVLDLQGAGNKILIAMPNDGLIGRAELAKRATTISKDKHFRFDLGELVTAGYHGAEPPATRGRVLRDKTKPAGAE